ncbi:MAG: replication-associated recombination protein A [Candidatus Kerfeldbacteria bacterium]|nr:replication-associated recombination protein A [Candidatus Kerfeldbacteria bacterium]
MADLFDHQLAEEIGRSAPLADRLRPTTLAEFVGQNDVVGPTSILRRAVENDELFSLLLWGPPGTGKTTLARIVAQHTKATFVGLSGVMSSKDDLLQAVRAASERRKFKQQRTILFVDEIHRWNKAQQDALLPYVENGTVTLIGATTENPSFEVISPLLSRCKVFVLERLQPEHLQTIIERALADTVHGYGGQHVVLEPQALELLTTASNGDARTALNTLELAYKATSPKQGKRTIVATTIVEAFQKPHLLYDKKGEEHYNIISAFIKSMRGSDPDGTLYWLGRMVEAGEDPLFIASRMVVFASEDISVADVHALPLAVACMQACDMIGLPECVINLSHVATYLATCPKSNATYVAYGRVVEDVQATLNEPVPLHLRNAPTKLMKELGYHQGYKYSHDYSAAEGKQEYLPKKLSGQRYFQPPVAHHDHGAAL